MRTAKTIGLLCLLIGAICLAQEPYHNSLAWRAQQWVSSGSVNPRDYLVGVEEWWVASDYALTNETVTTNWVDRVSGKEWTFYTGNSITNMPDTGFRFSSLNTSNNCFTNVSGACFTSWTNSSGWFTNIAISFLIRYRIVIKTAGTPPGGYVNTWVGPGGDNGQETILRSGGGTPYWTRQYGGGGLTHAYISNTNLWYVLTLITTNTAANQQRNLGYTNGVLSLYVTNQMSVMTGFGIRTNSTTWAPFMGDLQEIILQTNTQAAAPDVIASNVYKYFSLVYTNLGLP